MFFLVHIVRVVNGHTSTFPRLTGISPVTEPRYTFVQVPLSGLLASLLSRAGRKLYVPPKSAGPNSLSLDASPFRTTAYNYDGLVSEIPASYAASASLQHGTIPEVNLIFQTTSFQENRNTVSELTFSVRRDACLNKQHRSSGVLKGVGRGVHAPTGFPFRNH